MSNLGFLTVHRMINQHSGWAAERAFLPETGRPARAFESGRPLIDFDLLAVSLSFENDYVNFPKILDAADIPVRADQRSDEHPLTLAGGVAPSLNPEPPAKFVDCFLLGEAEVNLPPFLDWLSQAKDPRHELADAAKEVPGLYAPAFYDEVYNKGRLVGRQARNGVPERIFVPRLTDTSQGLARAHIVSDQAEFADTALIEIGRGCGRACRFCAAGYALRPPRAIDGRQAIPHALEALELAPRVGLVSAAITDTPHIEELCAAILQQNAFFTVSSIRADGLTPTMAQLLARAGQKTLTLAPEAGSDRLRRVINKGIDEDDLKRAIQAGIEAGILHLRLYFMIGLPTETDHDVREIVELTKRLQHHVVNVSRGKKKIGQVTLSVSTFVPKAHTPFQWTGQAEQAVIKARAAIILGALGKVGGVKVHFDVVKWARIEALLARGDRRVADILTAVHQGGGNWPRALKASPVNPEYFVTRDWDHDEILPWDFLDTGLSKAFLQAEAKRALLEKTSPPCDVEDCHRCGVC